MITRAELDTEAKNIGFSLRQAEKEYLQHVVLHALYAASTSEFVFKGGTALQKIHGLDRFSEDLDFTCTVDAETCIALVEKAIGIIVDASISKKEVTDVSVSLKARVKGPLYNGKEISVQAVTVECSTRERVLHPANPVRIVPRYRDLRPYIALVMENQEMLAEKIRAIMTRNNVRDLYDTWFLLQKGFYCNLDMVNAKLSYYKKIFGVQPFHDSILAKSRAWVPELGLLVRKVPSFEEVAPVVERQVLDMLAT
jgi:predicted nucleotidyltransferase component of viral defense system